MYFTYASRLQEITKEPDSITMDLFREIKENNDGKTLDEIYAEYKSAENKETYARTIVSRFHLQRFKDLMSILEKDN